LHGTEYKITCGVCVCARARVLGPHISKTVEDTVEARFQWDTNRKWHMANRMVAWPITSRDPERSS